MYHHNTDSMCIDYIWSLVYCNGNVKFGDVCARVCVCVCVCAVHYTHTNTHKANRAWDWDHYSAQGHLMFE